MNRPLCLILTLFFLACDGVDEFNIDVRPIVVEGEVPPDDDGPLVEGEANEDQIDALAVAEQEEGKPSQPDSAPVGMEAPPPQAGWYCSLPTCDTYRGYLCPQQGSSMSCADEVEITEGGQRHCFGEDALHCSKFANNQYKWQ